MGEAVDAEKDHRKAVDSALSLWRLLSAVRGARVAEHPRYLVSDGAGDAGGVRVVVGPDACSPDDADRIRGIVDAAGEGPVLVEDHSMGLDFSRDSGLVKRPLPVMVRRPGPPPESGETVHVRELASAAELLVAERMIVEDFPAPIYQPHIPQRMLPPELLADPRVTFLAARRGGGDAGACLVLRDTGVTGIYWLVTASAHRSAGVGRALMTAALRLAPELPTALVATAAGEPLYDSLGFERVAVAHWWGR